MVLKGITWDHARGYEPLVAASAQYEKKYGTRIEWQKRSLSLFGDQSIEDLSKTFDLLILDHPHVGIMAQTGCVSPLDLFIGEDEIKALELSSGEPSFSSYLYKEKQWALPIDAALQTAAYREDLLNHNKLPQNWVQVFEMAGTLKKSNLKIGIALCPTDCLCSFLSLTAQLGSPIREGNKIMVDPKVGHETLKMLRRLRDLAHENSLDWNPIQLYDYMAEHADIAYSPLGFCYTNYSREGFRSALLSFANPPGISHAVLGGAGISVSSKSEHKQEAAKFAYWVCTEEVQNGIYVLSQGQPAHQKTWKDERANRITHNFFRQCIGGLQSAYIRPRYYGWPAFQQRMGEIIHGFLANDLDIDQVLGILEENYRASYEQNLPHSD
jgi:multiple sugar transport system substrate-binding protein